MAISYVANEYDLNDDKTIVAARVFLFLFLFLLFLFILFFILT